MELTDKRKSKLNIFLLASNGKLHPLLETIKFDCFFSIHLYRYLKTVELKDLKVSITSAPFEINLLRMSKRANISKNTAKKALRELLQIGLLVLKETPDENLNSRYKVILINDKYIGGWNASERTFNFKFNAPEGGTNG
jgi:hypothetical protein